MPHSEQEMKEIEKMYVRITPLTEKMRAKYPVNIDGLEPALTNDIAEIVVAIRNEDSSRLIERLEGEKKMERWAEHGRPVISEENIAYNSALTRAVEIIKEQIKGEEKP